jgi:hypothetical protein
VKNRDITHDPAAGVSECKRLISPVDVQLSDLEKKNRPEIERFWFRALGCKRK